MLFIKSILFAQPHAKQSYASKTELCKQRMQSKDRVNFVYKIRVDHI